MSNYLKDFINIILMEVFKIINNYYYEKKDFYDLIIEINKQGKGIFCPQPELLGYIILTLLFFTLIFLLFWLLVKVIYNIYIYLKLTTFLYIKENPRLLDNPLFIQVSDIYYLNDYFSIDLSLLLFIIIAILILIIIYVLELATQKHPRGFNHFTLIKYYCILIIITGITYYLIIYKNITALGKRMNAANNLIYNNINVDFVNSQKICNYLNKRNDFDYNFIYGKCNDVKNNISITKLYDYIKSITDDIQQNIAPINNITIEKFKTLKDKKGILYKDKIISALVTFQVLKYYIDNDLIDEAKEFFATYNLLYLKGIGSLRQKINPILYLRFDDIMIFKKNYDYNPRMAYSFGDNKNIYNYIYSEFSRIQNNLQSIVVDIYNIVSYKLISIYAYYFIMFILLVIFIIIYIYNN